LFVFSDNDANVFSNNKQSKETETTIEMNIRKTTMASKDSNQNNAMQMQL